MSYDERHGSGDERGGAGPHGGEGPAGGWAGYGPVPPWAAAGWGGPPPGGGPGWGPPPWAGAGPAWGAGPGGPAPGAAFGPGFGYGAGPGWAGPGGPAGWGPGAGYGPGGPQAQTGAGAAGLFAMLENAPGGIGNLLKDDFTRGLVVGAGAMFLLSNPKVQERAITTLVQLWEMAQGGMAEMKERFRDAEAEVHRDEDDGAPGGERG